MGYFISKRQRLDPPFFLLVCSWVALKNNQLIFLLNFFLKTILATITNTGNNNEITKKLRRRYFQNF